MNQQKKLSALVLYYNGTHDDDEDTRKSALGIAESLRRTGHRVRKISVTQDNWHKAVKTPGDVVFNLVEDDTWELYLKVGERLEELGRAQVGHDRKDFELVINKSAIKRRLKRHNIHTPNFKIFNRKSKLTNLDDIVFPLIIKPSHQHAGIGISQKSVVSTESQLVEQMKFVFTNYPGEVIAEEFIAGREIHVTVMGNGKSPSVLPLCEIGYGGKFKHNWAVYTYEAKWDKKSWEYWDARVEAPAKIPHKIAKKICGMAVAAFHAFECRDIARFDIRINEDGTAFLVDVNMNPSLNYYDEQDATLASVYAVGWSYDQFLEKLIAITYARRSRK